MKTVSARGSGLAEEQGEICSLEGPLLPGQDKWLGGALGSDGNIYGIPGSSKVVLKIVPRTGEVTTFGGPFEGKFKWLRGVPAGDGSIYGIPSNAAHVLKITPASGEVTTIGGPFEGK